MLPPTDKAPSTDDLDGWIVTEGSPSMKTWVLHTSAAGDMMSGIWECTINITPNGGTPVTLQAGDPFVVEPMFKGICRIEENVRKHFGFRLYLSS